MNETTERVLRETIKALDVRIEQQQRAGQEAMSAAQACWDVRDQLRDQRDDIAATLEGFNP